MGRIAENKQKFYTCGQCKTKIFYLASDEPTKPCPDCGWNHLDRKKYSVPSEFKHPIS